MQTTTRRQSIRRDILVVDRRPTAVVMVGMVMMLMVMKVLLVLAEVLSHDESYAYSVDSIGETKNL